MKLFSERPKKETQEIANEAEEISRRDFLRGAGKLAAGAAAAGVVGSEVFKATEAVAGEYTAERAKIELIQGALRLLNLYSGEPTGRYDDGQTESAIKAYQKSKGQPETGRIEDIDINQLSLEALQGGKVM